MNQVEKVAEILKNNGIVIYPTETTYAIGCRVDSKEAIERLYKIKVRAGNQPTSVVCADLDQVKVYCSLTGSEMKLVQAFWPGPLTICLKSGEKVPKSIVASDGTLGVRVPKFAWLNELLNLVGVPLLAPSANFGGEKPPIRFNQIDKALADLVDYVVDIEPGGSSPSTIVKVGSGAVQILRTGEIAGNQIEERIKGA